MSIINHISPDKPCFIIAEAGVNHNGKMELAHKLIDCAKKVGANSIKFQAFHTEELVTPKAIKAPYQQRTTGSGAQFDMLKMLELSGEQHLELKRHCEKIGIFYLCTPYDLSSVELLERINVEAYKIASTDTDNIPFLREVAQKGRPIILSTGMTTLGELEESVDVLLSSPGMPWVGLLHCTSEYPANVADSNLRVIKTLQQAFGLPVGFSDHTEGISVSPLAVALGACIVEKHFTLDRNMPGPDQSASLEPSEFLEMIKAIRSAEAAFGDGIKRILRTEWINKSTMRKSLVARVAIPAGTIISAESVSAKRPGGGLTPSWIDRIVGQRAACDISPDEQITLRHVAWP